MMGFARAPNRRSGVRRCALTQRAKSRVTACGLTRATTACANEHRCTPKTPGALRWCTAAARKIPGYGLRSDPGYDGARKRAPLHAKNPGAPRRCTAAARKIPGYGLRPDPGYDDARKRAPLHAKNPRCPAPVHRGRAQNPGLRPAA